MEGVASFLHNETLSLAGKVIIFLFSSFVTQTSFAAGGGFGRRVLLISKITKLFFFFLDVLNTIAAAINNHIGLIFGFGRVLQSKSGLLTRGGGVGAVTWRSLRAGRGRHGRGGQPGLCLDVRR